MVCIESLTIELSLYRYFFIFTFIYAVRSIYKLKEVNKMIDIADLDLMVSVRKIIFYLNIV